MTVFYINIVGFMAKIMKYIKTWVYNIGLLFMMNFLLGCPPEELPLEGFTDENVVIFNNKTKNIYSLSMTKNNEILKIIKLDSQTNKGFRTTYNMPRVSIDLNNDSTVYFFDNLKTLQHSRVAIYYEFVREKYYEPENSLRIKVLKINSDLQEKLIIDTSNSYYYYRDDHYPLIINVQ